MSTGQREPTTEGAEQSYTVTDSSVEEGLMKVTFLQPKSATTISGDSTKLIWAWTKIEVEGGDDVDSQISFHGTENYGNSGSKPVNLLAASSGAEGANNESADSSSPNPAYLTAHVYLMIFAWAISMPAGIFIARFLKGYLGVW
jgi:hypothetical protein